MSVCLLTSVTTVHSLTHSLSHSLSLSSLPPSLSLSSRYVTLPVPEELPPPYSSDKEGEYAATSCSIDYQSTTDIKKEEEEESHDRKEESHDRKEESHGVEEMEVGVTKEPEVSEEGKQGEEESNMDTENNDSTAQEKKEEKIEGEKIEEEKIEDETEKSDEKAKERVFQLVVVNSYGSQEVNKLKEDDKLLKLTSESLAHCFMNLLNNVASVKDNVDS